MRYRSSVFQTFALITQLGLSMLAPIILCILAGSFLQNRFALPVFLPLLILGILAGVRNCYVLIQHVLENEKKEKERERAERIERAKQANQVSDGENK